MGICVYHSWQLTSSRFTGCTVNLICALDRLFITTQKQSDKEPFVIVITR